MLLCTTRHVIDHVVGASLLAVVCLSSFTLADSKIVVGTIDSAGIHRLIKAKDGPTVIVAMAAWCLPCREELPILVKLYNKYRRQGLKMVGISLDLGGPSAILPILEKAHANFPVYWAGEEAVRDFNIRAIPLLLLVKDGAIVEKVAGKRSEAFLDKKINDLLK